MLPCHAERSQASVAHQERGPETQMLGCAQHDIFEPIFYGLSGFEQEDCFLYASHGKSPKRGCVSVYLGRLSYRSASICDGVLHAA
jgi:hypothetical protein